MLDMRAFLSDTVNEWCGTAGSEAGIGAPDPGDAAAASGRSSRIERDSSAAAQRRRAAGGDSGMTTTAIPIRTREA
ncbi:hypothetical protein MANAM107_17430 [Actinomyces capricornis]|uniref:Uncharacterized protein n=1 Tax=Actinomyces capricornis TaxID=2755559 RepID=A0ABM7UMM1_9ACTO|nr:hypothetical protein MANAM107_17430 [Actinomyces capricornis]